MSSSSKKVTWEEAVEGLSVALGSTSRAEEMAKQLGFEPPNNKTKLPEPTTRFWACCTDEIGESYLPWGADGPVRMAVQEAIEKMTGLHVGLASGWHHGGEERRGDISFAGYEPEIRDSLLTGAPVKPMSELRKAWLEYRKKRRSKK